MGARGREVPAMNLFKRKDPESPPEFLLYSPKEGLLSLAPAASIEEARSKKAATITLYGDRYGDLAIYQKVDS